MTGVVKGPMGCTSFSHSPALALSSQTLADVAFQSLTLVSTLHENSFRV